MLFEQLRTLLSSRQKHDINTTETSNINMEISNAFAEYTIRHQNAVAAFRGHILNYLIMVESIVENFIATVFNKEEKLRLVFISELLHNKDVSFSTKINVFDAIIQVKFKEKYDKLLINKINNKRDLRNKLAHGIIYTIPKNLNSQSLHFMSIKNHKKIYFNYPIELADRLVEETHDLIFELEKYAKELEAELNTNRVD